MMPDIYLATTAPGFVVNLPTAQNLPADTLIEIFSSFLSYMFLVLLAPLLLLTISALIYCINAYLRWNYKDCYVLEPEPEREILEPSPVVVSPLLDPLEAFTSEMLKARPYQGFRKSYYIAYGALVICCLASSLFPFFWVSTGTIIRLLFLMMDVAAVAAYANKCRRHYRAYKNWERTEASNTLLRKQLEDVQSWAFLLEAQSKHEIGRFLRTVHRNSEARVTVAFRPYGVALKDPLTAVVLARKLFRTVWSSAGATVSFPEATIDSSGRIVTYGDTAVLHGSPLNYLPLWKDDEQRGNEAPWLWQLPPEQRGVENNTT